MTKKTCDHTSVGMIIRKDKKLLLIERGRPPFGFAPPAGHVDDHGSFEQAAKDEVWEEVGLTATKLKLIIEGRRENFCRRRGGTWHYWKLYEVEVKGSLNRSKDEAKQVGWYSKEEVKKLAKRTEGYLAGKVSENEWQKNPGLEVAWYKWAEEIKII